MESEFYEKYRDTYYMDCIFIDCFSQTLIKRPLKGVGKMTYTNVCENSITMMNDFFNLFWNNLNNKANNEGYKILKSFYLDPDGFANKKVKDIVCNADGLISIDSFYYHEGLTENLVNSFKVYREKPIIFFPSERGGINSSKVGAFKDRIDSTLFDIKKYYEASSIDEKKECKLYTAYSLPKTKQWLDEMESFEKIIEWLGIRGIFTNEEYEVFDLEKNDGSIITNYRKSYSKEWSDEYYKAMQRKIEIFNNK